MRKPRPKQRFPDGGKNLYELLCMDHEPTMVSAFPRRVVTRERGLLPDTLIFDREIDPMLYFWPVEGQHICTFLWEKWADSDRERLAKAHLRDGAMWVTIMWPTSVKKHPLEWTNWGDPEGFMNARYSPALAPSS